MREQLPLEKFDLPDELRAELAALDIPQAILLLFADLSDTLDKADNLQVNVNNKGGNNVFYRSPSLLRFENHPVLQELVDVPHYETYLSALKYAFSPIMHTINQTAAYLGIDYRDYQIRVSEEMFDEAQNYIQQLQNFVQRAENFDQQQPMAQRLRM